MARKIARAVQNFRKKLSLTEEFGAIQKSALPEDIEQSIKDSLEKFDKEYFSLEHAVQRSFQAMRTFHSLPFQNKEYSAVKQTVGDLLSSSYAYEIQKHPLEAAYMLENAVSASYFLIKNTSTIKEPSEYSRLNEDCSREWVNEHYMEEIIGHLSKALGLFNSVGEYGGVGRVYSKIILAHMQAGLHNALAAWYSITSEGDSHLTRSFFKSALASLRKISYEEIKKQPEALEIYNNAHKCLKQVRNFALYVLPTSSRS